MKKKILLIGPKSYLGHNILRNLKKIFPNEELDVQISVRDKNSLDSISFYFDPSDEQSYANIPRNWDALFYLLSPGQHECQQNPILARQICSRPIQKILDISPPHSEHCLFCYFSTIHVWGTPIPSPLPSIPYPKSVYAKVHHEAELALIETKIKFQKKILRIGNVFGGVFSNHRGRDLIGNFIIAEMLRDRSIELKDNGLQYRNFVPLSYFIEMLRSAILTDNPEQVIHLTWPDPIQIFDFGQKVSKMIANTYHLTPSIKYGTQIDPQTELFKLPSVSLPSKSFEEYLIGEINTHYEFNLH